MMFPSVAWFDALGEAMETDRATHERVGEIDTTCIWSVFDAPEGDFHVRLAFEEYSLCSVVEVTDDFDADDVDPDDVAFVLEADFEDWREMIEHLALEGKPDREHTLNYLSLPGTPFRCWSPDPLGRDMFFRFNQSLQVFVNASARLDTTFPQTV